MELRPERTEQQKEQIKALWLACKAGDVASAEHMLKVVNPNERLYENDPLDESGYDDSTCMHYAATEGHLAVVKLLHKHGATINPREQNGWIPLVGTIARGHKDIVAFLLEHGANVTNIDDVLGHMPLATALQCLDVPIAKLLLAAGAPIMPLNPRTHRRIYQGSALHILCERLLMKPLYAPEYAGQETEDRALALIEMLRMRTIDLEYSNENGNTVFHMAARLNNYRIIAALLVSNTAISRRANESKERFKTTLLCAKRRESSMSRLPNEVLLRIFSYMALDCKQAGIEPLLGRLYVSEEIMRTRFLDELWHNPSTLDQWGKPKHDIHRMQRYSFGTLEECDKLICALNVLNDENSQAHTLSNNRAIQSILDPICWH